LTFKPEVLNAKHTNPKEENSMYILCIPTAQNLQAEVAIKDFNDPDCADI
jgi:hypothetical protein